MNKWRPEGWKNPCRRNIRFDYALSQHEIGVINYNEQKAVETFEAGADAMLEAIWKIAKESPTGLLIIDSQCSIFLDSSRANI